MRQVKFEMTVSQKIKNVSHKTLQSSAFFISKTLNEMIIKILQNRIDREILKFCHELYCNSNFLIKKKEFEKYQFIHATMKINQIYI